MQMAMSYRQTAEKLIAKLESHGFTAYMVGGCVRDQLLNQPVSDIDIATSAKPEQVMQLFDRTVPTGLQHGTVLVLCGDFTFEVTTFRTESDYIDYRRPTNVTFVDAIEADLARRDFTINAMALGRNGQVVDPYGGQRDLQNRTIRCVGDARKRFVEDALRMLRGVRFHAQLGFEMAAETEQAIVEQRQYLKHIAMERVGSELQKMMMSDSPIVGWIKLIELQLLAYTKVQLQVDLDFWASTFAEKSIDFDGFVASQRWAALFIWLQYEKKEAISFMDRIKLSRDLQQQVGAIIACYALIYYGGHTKEAFVACVLQHGKSSVEQCVPIFERCNPELEEYCTQIQRWLLEMPVYTVAELAIRGADLVQVGVLPGPAIGEGLQHILQQVALGLVENDRISLLNYMKSKMEGTK